MPQNPAQASQEPTPLEKLGAAIEQALEDAPIADVLSVLKGAFISITLELVRRQGHDADQPLMVDGGPNRDVTIHPPK